MSNKIFYSLGLLASAALGAGVMYFYMKKSQEDYIEGEIEEMRNYFYMKLAEEKAKVAKEKPPVETYLKEEQPEEVSKPKTKAKSRKKNEPVNYTASYDNEAGKENHEEDVIIRNIFEDEQWKEEDIDGEIVIRPVERVELEGPTPHPISENDFSISDYEVVSLSYYTEDDTLVDDTGVIMVDREVALGKGALDNFGTNQGNPDVIYIRNERRQTDYEIIRVYDSYK